MIEEIKFNDLNKSQLTQLAYLLLNIAKNNKFLFGKINLEFIQKYKNNIIAIYDNKESEVIGFFAPVIIETGDYKGFYNSEYIFIHPKNRNRGIATNLLKKFFSNKKGLTVISDDNIGGIKLHKNIGFSVINVQLKKDNEYFHYWIKE